MITTCRLNKFVKTFIVLTTLMIGVSTSAVAQFDVYGIIKTPKKKKYHGEVITYEPHSQMELGTTEYL